MNDTAYQYYQSVKERFHDICEPLLRHFDIRVAYLKFLDNDQYLFLNNYDNDQFTHLRLTQIHNDGQFFSQHRQKAKSQKKYYHLWPSVVKEEDLLMQSLYEADIWNGFSIIDPKTDGDEIFSFVTKRSNRDIANFYVNNFDILNYFITYFKSKAFDLIDTSDQRKLASLHKTNSANSVQTDKSFGERVQNFMDEVHIDRFAIDTKQGPQHLSKREFDSLSMVAQGKTAKEIANELSISPRTVETYLNKVKHKTGLVLRSDLVQLLDGIVSRQEILTKHK